ncbi:MAG: PHP domain-containing protein, partial [Planctomycetota bacterium]
MTPLHLHSWFSLSRGASSPDAMVRAAKAAGARAVALTDRDGLYGLPEFLNACEEHGVRPIVGAEIAANRERAVLLAKNAAGYATLCRTITARHLDPAFSLACALARNREGLAVLSDCVDVLAPLLERSRDDLYVEVRATAPHAAASALTLGLPPVATPDAWFAQKDEWEVHRLLRAIDNNATFSSLAPGEIVSPEAWLKSEPEIRKLVSHVPGAMENAERLAEECRFFPDRSLVFPTYPVEDPEALLESETWAGARVRYGEITETVKRRVERELQLIREKRFTAYFLIVRDIARRAPRICGRGSAAASIVAYCLGITQVDPVEHNLFFERFLNEGRIDPPDIDIDFAWDERDAVIEGLLRDWNAKTAGAAEGAEDAEKDITKSESAPALPARRGVEARPLERHGQRGELGRR